MRILFASAEVSPYSKTGGLGDVAGALPPALVARGHQVVVATPLYGSVERTAHGLRRRDGGAMEADLGGARVIFVENDALYGRSGVYGEGGEEYPDNAERFAFLSRSLLPIAEACFGGAPDILHLNDWQTGLAALELARRKGAAAGVTRSVFTIHNLGYQGIFPKETVDELGIGWDAFTSDGLEFWDQVNFLKAGLAFSDLVTTVSPTYAQEIQGPEQGFGLDGMLRSRADRLMGILNGVDHGVWSPEIDPHLTSRYSREIPAGKRRCRDALAAELEIDAPPQVMVIGIVSRFAAQKGFDLLLEALPRLLEREVAFAILGSGEQRYERWLERAAAASDGRIGLRTGFDEGLAHRIYAGTDAFLMPSLYEPCGLSQLYALRYGSVPIVRRTGGLADTVAQATRDDGTGFLFDDFSADALLAAVDEARVWFADPGAWEGIRARGMAQDHSWDAAARSYEAAYRRAMRAIG